MSAAILLLTLAACFPQLELGDGQADGGGVGGDGGGDGSGDDGGDGGDAGGGSDGGDDGATPPVPTLSSAAPAHGSNSGGMRVTLRGEDFGDAARVWFGDREATVISGEDDLLEVEAPASPDAVGPVAIRVQTDGGEDSLASAFQYWEDASGSAITVLRARSIEGWDGSGWWTSFQALGWNTTPMDAWSTDTQAGMSSCTSTYSISYAEIPPASLDIDGDQGSLSLEPIDGERGLSYVGDAPDVSTLEGTHHTVSVGEDGAWPSYEVEDGIAFPNSLELFSPNPDDYESHDLDEFVVEWEAADADRMLVGFFDASSDALVICTLSNTGEFSVPGDTYASFVPSESAWWGQAWVMQIVVLAYKDTATVLDFNNGELRAQGGIGYATWVRVEDSWL